MTIYKVTIERTQEEVVIAGREWGPVNGEPGTPYAYTPQIDKITSVKREIYQQTVNFLDLSAVIAAVNKRSRKSAKTT
jgi:hypothetical protein